MVYYVKVYQSRWNGSVFMVPRFSCRIIRLKSSKLSFPFVLALASLTSSSQTYSVNSLLFPRVSLSSLISISPLPSSSKISNILTRFASRIKKNRFAQHVKNSENNILGLLCLFITLFEYDSAFFSSSKI